MSINMERGSRYSWKPYGVWKEELVATGALEAYETFMNSDDRILETITKQEARLIFWGLKFEKMHQHAPDGNDDAKCDALNRFAPFKFLESEVTNQQMITMINDFTEADAVKTEATMQAIQEIMQEEDDRPSFGMARKIEDVLSDMTPAIQRDFKSREEKMLKLIDLLDK